MHPLILVLTVVSLLSVHGQDFGGITNKQVTRNIDLTSQFARQTAVATVTSTKSSDVYYVAFESKIAEHLAFVEVTDASGARLVTKKTGSNDAKDHSYTLYAVTLKTPLSSGSSTDLTINAVFTHSMTPYPASIGQAEKQLVRYFDSHFFASPYPTSSQTTTVKLPSAQIESRSEQSPTSAKGETITYGPYEDIKAFTFSQMTLHFENNKPFLTATSLVKEIEVSHWSNVAVEETYQIQHDGAKLKGAFSRYDYQRTGGAAPAHISVMRHNLPHGAADVYYRDDIGNISTSTMTGSDSGVALDLTPRFPLFGGWKFGFYMGYNLPSSYVLGTDARDSSRFVLNITFATDLQDTVVDDLVVRVILPEGARNPEVFSTIDFDSVDTSKLHYTYLDTSGRPVVEIRRKNVVGEHNKYFQVTYHFGSLSLFQEPFLLISAFALFFAAVMAYVRFEFNVGSRPVRSTNAHRGDDLLLRFKDIMDQRFSVHEAIDDLLSVATGDKNVDNYNTKKQRFEAQLSKLKGEAAGIVTELERLGETDSIRRVKAIEEKQERRSAAQNRVHATEVAHKINRTVPKADYDKLYGEQETAFNTLEQEIAGDVSDLTESV